MAAQSQTAARARRVPRMSYQVPRINWLWLVLVALLVLYWLFARSLERIDGDLVLARVMFPDLPATQQATITYASWASFTVEMLHPRVLRHFIPIIIGWWLAVEAAVSLVQVLYNCPDRKTARDFLKRLRRGHAGSTELPLIVTPKSLDAMRNESILLRVGGPVSIAIPDGHAAVTERNGRFLRVLRSGIQNLGRFEYLLAIIDLTRQERSASDIPLLTKDGIRLTAEAGITFRIDPGEDPVTSARPYPFSEEAVRRAAYAGVVAANGNVSSWDDAPLGQVRGALGRRVADYQLDEIIVTTGPRETPPAFEILTGAVTEDVWESLLKDGIKPLQLRIGRLTPPEAVSRQLTEYWLAGQKQADQIRRAEETAELVREFEVARADAEVAMIMAIVEGVRKAQQEAGSNLSGYILAFHLLQALRRLVRYSSDGLQSITAADTSRLLLQSELLTERLMELENDVSEEQEAESDEDTAAETAGEGAAN